MADQVARTDLFRRQRIDRLPEVPAKRAYDGRKLMDDLGRIDRRRLLRQPDDANHPAWANHFQRLADRDPAAGRLEYDVGPALPTQVIAAHTKAVDHPFQRVAGAR